MNNRSPLPVIPGHPAQCHCGECYALRRVTLAAKREADYLRARFVLLSGNKKD